MTSPLADERTEFGPVPVGGAASRNGLQRQSQSLAWSRLGRALKRQLLPGLLTAAAILGCGAAFDLSGGVPLRSSAIFWTPIAAGFGFAAAFVLELRRNTITSLSSFGKHRGYAILGAAPELTAKTLRQLPPDKRTPQGCVAFQPASSFATAFRDLQGGLEGQALVSFIAPLPGDGATTAALCTAMSAVQQGRSVIAVDCDLRQRALTRALGYEADEGVLEACAEPRLWRSLVVEEPETGLHVLPAARMRSPWRSLVGAPGFQALLDDLTRAYDLVVLDCPPALANADGAMVAALADKCVVVAAWDRTRLNTVRATIRAVQRQHSRASTGVYVNRVPPQYRFGRLRPD